jgi:hypothetical protein
VPICASFPTCTLIAPGVVPASAFPPVLTLPLGVPFPPNLAFCPTALLPPNATPLPMNIPPLQTNIPPLQTNIPPL